MNKNLLLQFSAKIPDLIKNKNYEGIKKILDYDKSLANLKFRYYDKDLARYPLREAILKDDMVLFELLLEYDVDLHINKSIIVYELLSPNKIEFFNKVKDKIDYSKLESDKVLNSLIKHYTLEQIINNEILPEFSKAREIAQQEVMLQVLQRQDYETFNQLIAFISPDYSYKNGALLKLMVYHDIVNDMDQDMLRKFGDKEMLQYAITGHNNELAKKILEYNELTVHPRFLRLALSCNNIEVSSYMINKGASLEAINWGYTGQQAINVFGF